MATALKKRFACGCSVVKGTTSDELHLQGDVADDLVDYLSDNYKVHNNVIIAVRIQ
jgi:translation initiation factor 1 (eIF-1/SUI1)